MNTNKVTFAALAAMAVALSVAMLVSSVATPVAAKITPVTEDTGCVNNGGQRPPGQQPTCSGGGLTQETETENQNPTGFAPPGQNK